MDEGNERDVLIDLFHSFNLHGLVNSPTRVTHNSSTQIDNMFTNLNMDAISCEVFDPALSDHSFQLLSREEPFTNGETRYTESRKFSEHQIEDFVLEMSRTSWETVHAMDTVDKKYDEFITILLRSFETKFPVKRKKTSRAPKKTKNTWYSQELRNLSNRVSEAYLNY
jgi:HD-GYP domain-containing protein (c-di-GMP phosphodiesterase class II)